MTNTELLDFALSEGIINSSELEALCKDIKDKQYLERHFGKGYVLTAGKDGRYQTRLPNGKQIRKTSREDFVEAIVNYYQNEDGLITVSQVFEKWIDFKYKYDAISIATSERFKADYKRFFVKNPHAQDLIEKNIGEITEEELEYFIRDTIRSEKLTPKGWARFKSLVGGIWLYALKIKATSLYITKFFDTLSIKPKALKQRIINDEEQVFTDKEVKIILEEINRRGYCSYNYGIALCFYSGMRAGEISGLMWEDVSEDFRTIKVRHMEIRYTTSEKVGRYTYEVVDHTKTSAGIRTIVLPDAAIPYLKELYEETGQEQYVFLHNGRRIHAAYFSQKLYRLCKQLYLPPRRMHKIRKTVCSKLCDSGVDERFLLKQIGHTDKATTEQFYHRDRRTQEEKVRIINNAINY